MRVFKTILIVAGMYLAAAIAEIAVALNSSESQGGGISLLVILGIVGFLARKVGYRWFDCFFSMIPFYGIFFIFRVAHRTAFLPQRDWSERVTY